MTTLCLVELVTPWCMFSLCLSKYIYRIAWSIPCDYLLHNIWLPFQMICIFTFILTFHGSFSTSQLSCPCRQAYSCSVFYLPELFPIKGTSKSYLGAALSNPDLRWDNWLASPRHLKIKACFHGTVMDLVFSPRIFRFNNNITCRNENKT